MRLNFFSAVYISLCMFVLRRTVGCVFTKNSSVSWFYYGHAYEYKKLNYRWQTARRICAVYIQ